MQNSEKLRRAFDKVYDDLPFLASIVMAWEIEETTRFPYAATNGPVFSYNPEFFDTLKIADVVEIVIHEAAHIFLGHHLRFEKQAARDWNVAADLALHSHIIKHIASDSALRKLGCFPGQGQFAALPEAKSAEFYYKELRKPQQPEPQPEAPQEGAGQPQASEDTSSQPGESQNDSEDSDEGDESQEPESQDDSQDEADSDDSDDSDDDAGDSGYERQDNTDDSMPEDDEDEGEGDGGAGDEDGESEDSDGESEGDGFDTQDEPGSGEYGGQPLPDGFGDVLPHPGDPDKDMDDLVQEWQEQVAQAMADAASAGSLPGWAKELGTQQYESKSEVDWKSLLRRFLTQVSQAHYSYMRPNRKHSYRRDIILPTKRSKDAAPGCILVDTSGSMDQKQMNKALSEIESILSVYQTCQITMKQADTRLIEDATREFSRWDFPLTVPVEWKGRGGTNLGGAMKSIADEGEYRWLVVISDMYVSLGHVEDPGIPTIFIRTAPDMYPGHFTGPNFGQVIGPIAV